MPATTAGIEAGPDQAAAPERQDRLDSRRSSRTHARPIQRWLVPSGSPPQAVPQAVPGKLRRELKESEVLVHVEKAVAEAEPRLQRFGRAQPGRQPAGQVRLRIRHGEQCSNGPRKSATTGRRDAL